MSKVSIVLISREPLHGMPSRLSESDLERIEEFANLPAYHREPDMLLPQDAQEEAEADELD